MDVLNKKNYRAFKTRAEGAGVLELHARQRQHKGKTEIIYNAKDPRSGRVIEAVWSIPAKGRSQEEVAQKVEEFFEMAKQDFAVTVHKDGKTVKLEEQDES